MSTKMEERIEQINAKIAFTHRRQITFVSEELSPESKTLLSGLLFQVYMEGQVEGLDRAHEIIGKL